MLFITLISTDASSEEEDALIIYTASEDMIFDALMVELDYGDNWIDYLIAEYVLNGFNQQEIAKSNFSEIRYRLSNEESLRDILEDNYKGFLEIREHFYSIYKGLAKIEEVSYTYKDKEGELVEKTRLEMKSNIYHPFPEGHDYSHYNDFGSDRSFGGERSHQGNDIMADKGTPIIAVASGYIENIGWNTLGGYRIGIRDEYNRYWYYAHLQRYETGMRRGKHIEAGEIIGYVGDTGYGPPGTTGKFAPHLHIQIGVLFPGEKERVYINPYGIIKFSEINKLSEDIEEEKEWKNELN